ncbi:MAG: hypothetical protein HRT71_00190 [Flavobacteriales bacterium]|nr:hypothetical protein [Flavobacteriales bacterium]
MKYLNLFIISIFWMACGSPNESSESSTNEEAVEDVSSIALATEEWLTMTGKADKPNVVLIAGDEEYRSEEALPMLAKILSETHGFNCTVLFAQDPAKPGIVDPNYLNNITGLDQLKTADLMIMFTRFRALPDEQMKYIDDYLMSGKPVISIRTATHAFWFKGIEMESSYRHYCNSYQSEDEWNKGYGGLVMGDKWYYHHGGHKFQSTKGLIASGAENHPVLNGIEDGDIWGPSDVYGVRLPLPGDAQHLVLGQVTVRAGEWDSTDSRYGMRPTDSVLAPHVDWEDEGMMDVNLNDPMMLIAWTKTYQLPNGKAGKSFSSTIGAATDLIAEGTRRLMVNAAFWCLDLEVPEKANVDVIGTYEPTAYKSFPDSIWDNRDLKISSLQ